MNILLLSLLLAHGKADARFFVTCTVAQGARIENGALVRQIRPDAKKIDVVGINYEPEPRIDNGMVIF